MLKCDEPRWRPPRSRVAAEVVVAAEVAWLIARAAAARIAWEAALVRDELACTRRPLADSHVARTAAAIAAARRPHLAPPPHRALAASRTGQASRRLVPRRQQAPTLSPLRHHAARALRHLVPCPGPARQLEAAAPQSVEKRARGQLSAPRAKRAGSFERHTPASTSSDGEPLRRSGH